MNIDRVQIKFCTPVDILNNKTIGDTIIVYLSKYKNYQISELPFHESLENEKQVVYDSIKSEYFIQNLNDKHGYLIKHYNDSFLNKLRNESIMERNFSGLNGKFLDFNSLKTYDKKEIIKSSDKFILSYLTNNSFYDSLHLYFDKKMVETTFSINKTLDSLYRSKLYKCELFIKNDSLKKRYPMFQDFFVNSLEITPILDKNDDRLNTIFKRFILFEKNVLHK